MLNQNFKSERSNGGNTRFEFSNVSADRLTRRMVVQTVDDMFCAGNFAFNGGLLHHRLRPPENRPPLVPRER
ncbi:hypothetical protein ASE59_14850 [Sphingomonas sp. Leaf10]|nr:hypothetical protein ASE59_14850 [Sphingomonas sp. Leaf10]